MLGGADAENAFYAFINKYIYYFIFIGGTVIFFPYDFLIFKCQEAAVATILWLCLAKNPTTVLPFSSTPKGRASLFL